MFGILICHAINCVVACFAMMNYCNNAEWHGSDQSVAPLWCYGSPGCSSGLQFLGCSFSIRCLNHNHQNSKKLLKYINLYVMNLYRIWVSLSELNWIKTMSYLCWNLSEIHDNNPGCRKKLNNRGCNRLTMDWGE